MPNVYPAGRSAQQTASTKDTPGRQAPKMARSAGAPTTALPWATRPSAVSRAPRRNVVPQTVLLGTPLAFTRNASPLLTQLRVPFRLIFFPCSTPRLCLPSVAQPVSPPFNQHPAQALARTTTRKRAAALTASMNSLSNAVVVQVIIPAQVRPAPPLFPVFV